MRKVTLLFHTVIFMVSVACVGRSKTYDVVITSGEIYDGCAYQKLHPDKLSQGSETFFEKFLTMSMCESDNSGGFRSWIK